MEIYVDIHGRMPIKTRQGKIAPTTTKPDTTKTNMATPDVSTNCKPEEVDPDIDSMPDKELLLQILNNQKSS